MNLTEYRRELREAASEYRDTIDKATAILHERIANATDAFLGESGAPDLDRENAEVRMAREPRP